MGIISSALIIAWAAVGVYDTLESNQLPTGPAKIFLAGPVFWIIAGYKWFIQNSDKFKVR